MMTSQEASTHARSLADQARERTPLPAAVDHDHEHGLDWLELAHIAIVAIAAAAVWFRVWEPIPSISVIGIIGLLAGGWPIFKEAFENLIARRMTMELSMTIAVVAAAAIGEFFTALVIALFVLVAEVLEGLMVDRGRNAIRDLLEFLPRSIMVRRPPEPVREVGIDTLRVGETILVAPGGRIPVDGTVLSGHSFVDQARITGESMPIEMTTGANVYAGSINQSGALEIQVERIGHDTSYGKIIEAVERAERSRALIDDGSGLVGLSYRGYGGSSGRPTEKGLIEDAAAAYAFATARYPAERIVLWGELLGSALAIAVAAEKPVGCLVLEAPFTSAVDVGAMHYRFVPVRLLMKDQFRSDLRIGNVSAPVLVVHGENDAIVPVALGERLYGLIGAPKRFLRIAGAGHNDLGDRAVAAAKQFIAEQ